MVIFTLKLEPCVRIAILRVGLRQKGLASARTLCPLPEYMPLISDEVQIRSEEVQRTSGGRLLLEECQRTSGGAWENPVDIYPMCGNSSGNMSKVWEHISRGTEEVKTT